MYDGLTEEWVEQVTLIGYVTCTGGSLGGAFRQNHVYKVNRAYIDRGYSPYFAIEVYRDSNGKPRHVWSSEKFRISTTKEVKVYDHLGYPDDPDKYKLDGQEEFSP